MYALCDPFPNIKRIRKAKVPIFLMHGTHDQTIDYHHSLTLYEKMPPPLRREPYIVKGAGHENLVEMDPETYFAKLNDFIESVRVTRSAQSRLSSPGEPSRLPAPNAETLGVSQISPALDCESLCATVADSTASTSAAMDG